jgi:hypothetical protein
LYTQIHKKKKMFYFNCKVAWKPNIVCSKFYFFEGIT